MICLYIVVKAGPHYWKWGCREISLEGPLHAQSFRGLVKVGLKVMSGDELVMSLHCHTGGSGHCLASTGTSSRGWSHLDKCIFFTSLPCEGAEMVVVWKCLSGKSSDEVTVF